VGLLVGAGDSHEAASLSVTASRLRFATEIISVASTGTENVPATAAESLPSAAAESGERPAASARSRVSRRPAPRRAAQAD
jgi:hypothetical protein